MKNKSDLFSLLLQNEHKNNLNKLFLAFLLSLALSSCSGGSSSNGSNDSTSNVEVECSDGFGDASRCDARENL